MNFNKYIRLKKLVAKSQTFEQFLRGAILSPSWYGVPLWTKENYKWFFEKIKGGNKYVDLFRTKAA